MVVLGHVQHLVRLRADLPEATADCVARGVRRNGDQRRAPRELRRLRELELLQAGERRVNRVQVECLEAGVGSACARIRIVQVHLRHLTDGQRRVDWGGQSERRHRVREATRVREVAVRQQNGVHARGVRRQQLQSLGIEALVPAAVQEEHALANLEQVAREALAVGQKGRERRARRRE
eukprot:271879-Prymnesium_polylepis.2